MSRASLSRNGPRSGLSRAVSSMLMAGSGCFFLPELRSGEGLAREVEGEGDGVLFFGIGELTREELPGRIWVSVVGGSERFGGGVLADTMPGIFGGRNVGNFQRRERERKNRKELKNEGLKRGGDWRLMMMVRGERERERG